ncbi:MAG: hypothetical protein ACI85Z_001061, partial [Rheinheimera aquimaris]
MPFPIVQSNPVLKKLLMPVALIIPDYFSAVLKILLT